MPKIADVKSKSRSKRKPLRDVSNGAFKPSISNTVMKKSIPDTQQQDPIATCGGGGGCRDPLDRLLLAHSDLSVLIHQIDELVVQALEQKVSNKKEIESFSQVLNQMQTSLKPWISRFQKVLSTQPPVTKTPMEKSVPSKKIPPSSIKEENPNTYKFDDFLVSPSPLVHWRADCTQEGGKNLFMLTPLPKPSALSSKLPKSIFKKPPNDIKPVTIATDFSSPEKLVSRNNNNNNNNNCVVVSTPYLKMSPPKSCKLLEPASEFGNKNTTKGNGVDSDEASRSQGFGQLGLKYPEIFGIRNVNKLGNVRKAVEESPNWCISPPKTCVILEPSHDQDLVKKVVGLNLNSKTYNEVVIESTPMCKDFDTTVLRGKRAGENTLKKELWMRFEAATGGHELRSKATCGGGKTTTSTSNGCNNKGFMELLEEVCSDD